MKYTQENTQQLIDILKETGSLLYELYSTSLKINEKAPKDYVTSADIIIDDFLKLKLKKVISDTPIYSEEQNSITLNDNNWIIDPIDGTTNFILGIPHFAISIAYIENRQTLAGFVYNPITYEMYWTDPWNKAFLNKREITVSDRNQIDEMYGLFGFSANYRNITRYQNEWTELFNNSKKSIGILSPSLSICSVARGKSDFFVDFGCSVEGKVAAAEILRKAGGKVFNYDKELYTIESIGIIAMNKGKVF